MATYNEHAELQRHDRDLEVLVVRERDARETVARVDVRREHHVARKLHGAHEQVLQHRWQSVGPSASPSVCELQHDDNSEQLHRNNDVPQSSNSSCLSARL